MKFGYMSLNTACGIGPADIGRELENRGFESLWVPEHSHYPIGSAEKFPDAGRGMPDGYAHMMSPFISLMAAAGATSRLSLGTSMALGLEHDLLDLAVTAATLDRLSDSRLILGLGVGWNDEELANHRPTVPFKKRYSALKERVAALRSAWGTGNACPSYQGPYADTDWGGQISSFSGDYDSFTPSWVFPKPEGGAIPIALGLAGPVGMKHAASYADVWGPVDQALREDDRIDVAGRISAFYDMVAAAGRERSDVSITLFNISGVTDRMMDEYATLDIERIVFGPPTFMRHTATESLEHLDGLQKYLDLYGD